MMTPRQLQKVLWTGFKLGAAGATIAGIAFAFGIFDPDLTVQESEADIFALDLADRTPREKFESSLEQLGHPKARPFDLNGNLIFFSSRQTNDDPSVVMEDYQREFVNQGVNDELMVEIGPDDHDKMMFAGLTGGMVPSYVTPDYIVLGGMETATDVSTVEELQGLDETVEKTKFYDLFKSYKTVEIMRTPHNTLVTASWSDESFDFEKMLLDGDSEDRNVSKEVPACPGCTRVTAFQDLGEVNYRNDVFIGDASPKHMSRFYHQALGSRGWELTPASRTLQKVKQHVSFAGDDAILHQYARGGEFMTVMTHKDTVGDHSVVHTVQGN